MYKQLLQDIAGKEITILECFNLVDYDQNMSRLYQDLQKFLKEHFSNGKVVFRPNDRIVFIHHDLDFFLDPNLPGFTLYNLQLILRELDISNNFCAVISNLPNYSKYTKLVQEKLTLDVFPIKDITSVYLLVDIVQPLTEITINSSIINTGFCVLSRLSRFHRTYFVSQLFYQGLQNYGKIAYHNISNNNSSDSHTSIKNTSPCHFLTVDPFIRNNTETVIQHKQHQQQVRLFQEQVPVFKNFTEDIDITCKANGMRIQLPNDIIQSSLVYVGLETVDSYPGAFLSGITFKGIAHKRPFIIFGAPGTLKHLQSLGFQTFDDFWSEEYDIILNMEDRVEAIMEILTIISKKTVNELQHMVQQMSDKLEFNFQHLATTFPEQQRQNIVNGLQ